MPPGRKPFAAWCKLCRVSHAEGKHRPAARDRDALATAKAAGRTDGLREAFILLGVGLGIGLGNALSGSTPKPRDGQCRKGTRFGLCRLDDGHNGACEPESMYGKRGA